MSTECERLSDRMPDVARGRAVWGRTDADHLDCCSGCEEEWNLVRLAATHGVAMGRRVDAGEVSSRVLQRLRESPAHAQPAAARWRRALWPIAIAAAVSLVVWGGIPRGTGPAETPQTELAVLHELDDLTSAELEAMLDLVPDPAAPGFRTLDTPESLGDLSAEELELLLSSMED
jgi:hypothetical protein